MIDATQANPNSDDPSLKDRRLVSAIRAFPAPGFAVVDGGLFDDLPALLREQDLCSWTMRMWRWKKPGHG